MVNGERTCLSVLDGDSNLRLGLSSEFNPPIALLAIEENKSSTGGAGEVEGLWTVLRLVVMTE